MLYKLTQPLLSEGHDINIFKLTNELEIPKFSKWVSLEERKAVRER